MVEIEWLIYEHKDRLYGLCLHLEKDQDGADELFQDTWVKAIEKWHTFDKYRDFYPWLAQVAVNTYRDRLRYLKKEWIRLTQLDTEVDYKGDRQGIERIVIQQQTMQQVMACVRGLPDKYRLPLVLIYSEGMSYKEVAEVLGVDEKRVKSRVYDARQKVKLELEQEDLVWMINS